MENTTDPTTADPPKDITCPICLELLSDPRELPCTHVFCANCLVAFSMADTKMNLKLQPKKAKGNDGDSFNTGLSGASRSSSSSSLQSLSPGNTVGASSSSSPSQSTSSKGVFCCPVCRAGVPSVLDSIEKFPVSLRHKALVKQYRAITTKPSVLEKKSFHSQEYLIGSDAKPVVEYDPTKGSLCSTSECSQSATIFCIQGCGSLCDTCAKEHAQSRFASKHATSPIDSKGLTALSNQPTCLVHGGLPCLHYCKDCPASPFKCDKCRQEHFSSGSQHTFTSLLEGVHIVCRDVKLLLEKGKAKRAFLEDQMMRLRSSIQKSEDEHTQLEENVREYFKKAHEYLETIEAKMLEEIREGYGKVIKPTCLDEEDVQIALSQVDFGVKLLEEAISDYTDNQNPLKIPYARVFMNSLLLRELPDPESLPEPKCELPETLYMTIGKESSVTPMKLTYNGMPLASLSTIQSSRNREPELSGAYKDERPVENAQGNFYTIGTNVATLINPRKIFPEQGYEGEALGRPWGMAVHPTTGNIYVAGHLNHRIMVFSPNLKLIMAIGKKGSALGDFLSPVGIAISSTGMVAVVDFGNNRVQIFDSNLTFVRVLGLKGDRLGEFKHPHHATFDNRDYLYISDLGNKRIQVYNQNFQVLKVIGSKSSENPVGDAEAICIDDRGFLNVIARGGNIIMTIDVNSGRTIRTTPIGSSNSNYYLSRGPNGSITLSNYGTDSISFFANGVQLHKIKVDSPLGCVFGLDGSFYVVDSRTPRIIRY